MKKYVIATIAALALCCTTSEIAQASGSATTGSSCHLSKHWVVKFSAKWLNRNKHNTQGFLDYVVVSSPARLKSIFIEVHTADGSIFFIQDNHPKSKAPFDNRYDPNRANVTGVDFTVAAPSGMSSCLNFVFPDPNTGKVNPPPPLP